MTDSDAAVSGPIRQLLIDLELLIREAVSEPRLAARHLRVPVTRDSLLISTEAEQPWHRYSSFQRGSQALSQEIVTDLSNQIMAMVDERLVPVIKGDQELSEHFLSGQIPIYFGSKEMSPFTLIEPFLRRYLSELEYVRWDEVVFASTCDLVLDYLRSPTILLATSTLNGFVMDLDHLEVDDGLVIIRLTEDRKRERFEADIAWGHLGVGDAL